MKVGKPRQSSKAKRVLIVIKIVSEQANPQVLYVPLHMIRLVVYGQRPILSYPPIYYFLRLDTIARGIGDFPSVLALP